MWTLHLLLQRPSQHFMLSLQLSHAFQLNMLCLLIAARLSQNGPVSTALRRQAFVHTKLMPLLQRRSASRLLGTIDNSTRRVTLRRRGHNTYRIARGRFLNFFNKHASGTYLDFLKMIVEKVSGEISDDIVLRYLKDVNIYLCFLAKIDCETSGYETRKKFRCTMPHSLMQLLKLLAHFL